MRSSLPIEPKYGGLSAEGNRCYEVCLGASFERGSDAPSILVDSLRYHLKEHGPSDVKINVSKTIRTVYGIEITCWHVEEGGDMEIEEWVESLGPSDLIGMDCARNTSSMVEDGNNLGCWSNS